MTNRDDHAIGVSFHLVHAEILSHPADRPAAELSFHATDAAVAEVAANATVAVMFNFTELIEPEFDEWGDGALTRPRVRVS